MTCRPCRTVNRPLTVTSNTNELQTLTLGTGNNTFVMSYPGANEVQTLSFSAPPTSGTFTLTNGTTNAGVTIPASPTAANVTTAIQNALNTPFGARAKRPFRLRDRLMGRT